MKYLFLSLLIALISSLSTLNAQETSTPTARTTYGLPASVIEAYEPNIERIGANPTIMNRRDHRHVAQQPIDIVDAPNSSNVLYTRDSRTFYVTVNRFENGWAEINEGEWLPADALSAPVTPSNLNGVLFPAGVDVLEYPLGFSRNAVAFWSEQPGITAPITNDNAFPPYQLFNIFDEVEIDDTLWYQVGVDQWLPADLINVFKPLDHRPEEIDTRIWIAVDVENQFVMAFEGEDIVFMALASNGNPWTQTETGFHRIYLHYNSRYMSSGTPGDYWHYYVEDVPYTLYFNGDQALHGVYWHTDFGVYRSNGCVNLSMNDAYWLYHWTVDYMFLEAQGGSEWPLVYIYGDYPPDEEIDA